jgi:hypothetical protein
MSATVIASLSVKTFDMTAEYRLVQRRGRHYLIADHWCGNAVDGQGYRPFVYSVPADRVGEVKKYIRPKVLKNNKFNYHSWEYFVVRVLPSLECRGRKDRLAWAKGL